MTDRWFRFYDSVVDDPKVQRLTDAAFRAWVNLMCVASKNGGFFSTDIKDISFALRLSEGKSRDLIQVLQSAGLIERFETGWEPHNWSKRQYASDSSAERMRRHRAGKVTVNVTSHPVTSDAIDSEQNRTEQSDAVTGDFPGWYETYPRKVGKHAAEKAYRAALKRPDATPELLLAGLRLYVASPNCENPKFIAHPATWLNAGRWLDVPEPVPRSNLLGFTDTPAEEITDAA